MNVCEGIDLANYMENDISFNSINSDTKFGECFLRDVAENELEGLECWYSIMWDTYFYYYNGIL